MRIGGISVTDRFVAEDYEFACFVGVSHKRKELNTK